MKNRTKNGTTVERKSERELVMTRTIDGPVRLVFEAWTNAELFKRWWVPKSAPITLLSFEADIRTGGTYRLVFDASPSPLAFHGKYLEVTPHSRIVWTNDERGEDARSITTVTFAERDGTTLMVVSEVFPSKEALDEARVSGAEAGTTEAFDQLEELVVSLVASG